MADVSWAEVLDLVTKLDASAYEDVDLQMPGLHLRMSTSTTAFAPPAFAPPPSAAPAPTAAGPAHTETPPAVAPPTPAPVPVPQAAVPSAAAPSTSAVEVTTPILGTFYARPSPDAAPFVAVGDAVSADTTVAIVEVMKLMNPVTAGVAGRITEVCAADGDLVEHGQVLFRVEPS